MREMEAEAGPGCETGRTGSNKRMGETAYELPSRELTYPPKKWHFEDDFPFPKVGYVNSLEGNHSAWNIFLKT